MSTSPSPSLLRTMPVPKHQAPLPPAGPYQIARCYRAIDLGTQQTEFEGRVKHIYQIQLSWELPNAKHIFDEKNGPQPFVISKTYNFSFFEGAALAKDLKSWMGEAFVKANEENFSPGLLIGMACCLTISHKENKKNGTIRAVIDSIVPTFPNATVPPPINPSQIWIMGDGENEIFRSLPEWLKEKIRKSPEYLRSSATSEAPVPVPAIEEDYIPF